MKCPRLRASAQRKALRGARALTPADKAAVVVARRRAKDLRESILAACQRAVEGLERFASDARRELERADARVAGSLIEVPSHVLSATALGASNAALELSNVARLSTEYLETLAALEALQRPRCPISPRR